MMNCYVLVLLHDSGFEMLHIGSITVCTALRCYTFFLLQGVRLVIDVTHSFFYSVYGSETLHILSFTGRTALRCYTLVLLQGVRL